MRRRMARDRSSPRDPTGRSGGARVVHERALRGGRGGHRDARGAARRSGGGVVEDERRPELDDRRRPGGSGLGPRRERGRALPTVVQLARSLDVMIWMLRRPSWWRSPSRWSRPAGRTGPGSRRGRRGRSCSRRSGRGTWPRRRPGRWPPPVCCWRRSARGRPGPPEAGVDLVRVHGGEERGLAGGVEGLPGARHLRGTLCHRLVQQIALVEGGAERREGPAGDALGRPSRASALASRLRWWRSPARALRSVSSAATNAPRQSAQSTVRSRRRLRRALPIGCACALAARADCAEGGQCGGGVPDRE